MRNRRSKEKSSSAKGNVLRNMTSGRQFLRVVAVTAGGAAIGLGGIAVTAPLSFNNAYSSFDSASLDLQSDYDHVLILASH